jgi:hypothetical protein
MTFSQTASRSVEKWLRTVKNKFTYKKKNMPGGGFDLGILAHFRPR